MPDTPVGPMPPNPDLGVRVTKLEQEMGDVKSILGQMLPLVVRIDATLTATLPHLATKAEMEAGFRALESRISDLRVETQAGDAALRNEIRAVDADLRSEMQSGNASLREETRDRDMALRSELQDRDATFRSELLARDAVLRSEMETRGATLRTEMHDEFSKTRAELADKPGKTYLWMVLGALIMAYAAGLAALAVLK